MPVASIISSPAPYGRPVAMLFGWARGTVVYTDPSGTANRGSTIGLYTSTGVAPKPKETKKPDPTPTKPRKTKPPPNRD